MIALAQIALWTNPIIQYWVWKFIRLYVDLSSWVLWLYYRQTQTHTQNCTPLLIIVQLLFQKQINAFCLGALEQTHVRVPGKLVKIWWVPNWFAYQSIFFRVNVKYWLGYLCFFLNAKGCMLLWKRGKCVRLMINVETNMLIQKIKML